MSFAATRHHRLAPGTVHVRGEGPVVDLLEAHLGPAVDPVDAREEPLVLVDLARSDRPEAGFQRDAPVRIAGRRGQAAIDDGSPVRVRWDPRFATMRPLLAAAHLAARRRHSVLLQGGVLIWERGGGAVVVAGPSGAGKTRVLLAAVDAGAAVVAPDWSWLDVGLGTLFPLPQPMRVRPHHLISPTLRRSLPPTRRALLSGAGRIGGPVAARAYLDLPLTALGGSLTAATAADHQVGERLRGVLMLDDRDADTDHGGASGRTLARYTADSLVGTSSSDLLAHLGDVGLRHGPAGDPAAALELLRDLVS